MAIPKPELPKIQVPTLRDPSRTGYSAVVKKATPRRRRGRPPGNALIAARRKVERVERIHEMVEQNMTQVQIAEVLGVTPMQISYDYRAALELVPQRTVLQRRELQLLRIEQATLKVLDVLESEHPYVSEGREVFPVVAWETDPQTNKRTPVYGDRPLQDARPILQAATALTTLLKREADTVGTDAPKRVEAITAHVTAADLKINELVTQLQARNHTQAQAIAARATRRRALPASPHPTPQTPNPGTILAPAGADQPILDVQAVPLKRGKGHPQTAAQRRATRATPHAADPDRVRTWRPADLLE